MKSTFWRVYGLARPERTAPSQTAPYLSGRVDTAITHNEPDAPQWPESTA